MSNDTLPIQTVLVAPAPQPDAAHFAVSLGLVLPQMPVIWSVCHFYTSPEANYTTISQLVAEMIVPLWKKRPLSFALITEVASLTRIVERTRLVTPVKADGVTRRDIFSGQFTEEAPAPVWESYESVEPLPSALMNGLAELVIRAMAQIDGRLPIYTLADLFDCTIEKFSPRPTHLRLATFDRPVASFSPTLLSMGYQANGVDMAKTWGQNGARFQSVARRLKDHMRQATPKGRYVYLELGEEYGRLFENNVGKLLGACSGLERAVKPCALWVEDPLRLPQADDHDKAMLDLLSYMRMRQMESKVVAFEGVDSETAVQHIIDQKTAHAVRLAIEQFDNFFSFLSAIKLCQKHNFPFVIGSEHCPPPLLAWLGIMCQPRLLFTAHVDQCAETASEMYRAVMTLNQQ